MLPLTMAALRLTDDVERDSTDELMDRTCALVVPMAADNSPLFEDNAADALTRVATIPALKERLLDTI